MIRHNLRIRRRVRNAARVGAAFSAAMVVLSAMTGLSSSRPADAAAQNAGTLLVLSPPGAADAGQPLANGGSATPFALTPPLGAACAGDSATGGYRVQSYMVPASIDPGTLTFDSNGPLPAGTGASLRQPLFSSGTPFVNKTTAIAVQSGGTGQLVGLPSFSFDLFGASGPQIVPPGTYNVGFACTLGTASATQLDRYWNAQLTFTADATDVAAGIKWAAVAAPAATTTVVTTTTVAATTTTRPATTTTVHSTSTSAVTPTTMTSASTTTVAATTTSFGPASGTTTTAFTSSAPPTTSRAGSSPTIANTGSSPLPMVIWAILLLVFGRIAILLARPMRIRPPESR